MDSQPKSELQVSNIGRPVSNFLREGVPSKICFLCYGTPLSTYRVGMILYGRAMPNVQRWMKRLTQLGYLQHSESGYQLVPLKLVEEMNRTLMQNTNDKLSFTDDEKKSLTDFFDSQQARDFMVAIKPQDIGKRSSYDLCSVFSLIFRQQAKAPSKRKSPDTKDAHLLEKHANDPRFVRLLEETVKKTTMFDPILVTPISSEETRDYLKRFTSTSTPLNLIRFSLRLMDFMSSCSPEFVKKLSWSDQVALASAYEFSVLDAKLPSFLKQVLGSPAARKLRKAVRGEST